MRWPEAMRREMFLRLVEKPEGIASIYGRELCGMDGLLEPGKQVKLSLFYKEDLYKLSQGVQDEIYARYDKKTESAKGGKGK